MNEGGVYGENIAAPLHSYINEGGEEREDGRKTRKG